jgi:hypothetical protein
MALNFPNSPIVGELYQPSTTDHVFKWDGEKWVINQTVDAAGEILTHDTTRPVSLSIGAEGQVLVARPSIGGVKMRWEDPSSGFPSGTKMVFVQSSVPPGWTLQTGAEYVDAALRIDTAGAAVVYGSGFRTVFGTGRTTSSHILTVSEMPAHNHGVSGTFYLGTNDTDLDPFGFAGPSRTPIDGTSKVFSTQGGGTGHEHDVDLNLKHLTGVVGSSNG